MRTVRRATLGLAAAGTLLLFSGCTTVVNDPPSEPIRLLEGRLQQLADRADGFTAAVVGPDQATALARTGDTIANWQLTPQLSEGNPIAQRYPSVPFTGSTASSVAQEALLLAAECDDEPYQVRVEAFTKSTLLSTVRCGADTEPPFDEPPSAVRFAGAALPQFDGTWTADDWQRLLTLAFTANGSGMLEDIRVEDDGRILMSLGNTAETNGCRPALLLAADGTDAQLSCLERLDTVPGTIDGWAGVTLASAVDAVADEAGVRLGSGTEIVLQPEGTSLRITVREGGSSASAVVTP